MSAADLSTIFAAVPGFPAYRADRWGNIWTCYKQINLGWRYGSKWVISKEWRKLKQHPTKAGRNIVCLSPGTKWKQVSRLILEAFIGPCPPGMECCHDPDPNPLNNNLSNIRWDTRKANIADRARHGRMKIGESHSSAKLTTKKVLAIRAEYRRVYGDKARLARKYGVSHSVITAIIKRKTWKHLVAPAAGEATRL